MHKQQLRAIKLSATVWAASSDARMEQGFDVAIALLQKISLRQDKFTIHVGGSAGEPVIPNQISVWTGGHFWTCRMHRTD
jgi:hypothetical protein